MQDIRKPENQEKLVAGFEKLWVWQKAHKIMQEIHKFCPPNPKDSFIAILTGIFLALFGT